MSDDSNSPNDPEPVAPPDEPTEASTAEASTPGASTPGASSPGEPEAPTTAGEPVPDATVPQPVVSEPVAAEPVAAEPGGAAPPARGSGGLLVPTWVAVVLAVLLIGGIGFAIGYQNRYYYICIWGRKPLTTPCTSIPAPI